MPLDEPTSTRLTANRWIDRLRTGWVTVVAWLLIAVHGALIWGSREGRVGTGGDDAFYIWLARSIREGTYREIHRFDRPFHSQYPPGYATVLALGGDYASSTDPAIVIGVIAAVIALALLFDLCRRSMPPGLALGVLALAAFNPLTVDRSAGVFAEAAFTAVSMLALWLSIRFPTSRGALIGTTAAAIAATLLRSVGLTLVAAILIARIVERKPRQAIGHALASVLALGPWFLWTLLAPKPALDRSYVASVTHLIQSGRYGPIRAAFNALRIFFTEGFPSLLGVPTIPDFIADNVYWSLLIAGLLVVGLVVAWRISRIVPLYLVCYVALVAVWPFHPTRFLIPVTPVILWLIVLAGRWIYDRTRSKLVAGVAILSVLAVIGAGIRRDRALLARGEICRRGEPSCYPERGVSFFAAAEYARENLPRNAIVATVKEATFAYYSGLPVISHTFLLSYHNSNLLQYLEKQGIRYVLVSALGPSKLPRRLRQDCRRFRVIYQASPTAFLLQLDDGEVPEAEAACNLLAAWPDNAGSYRSS